MLLGAILVILISYWIVRPPGQQWSYTGKPSHVEFTSNGVTVSNNDAHVSTGRNKFSRYQ